MGRMKDRSISGGDVMEGWTRRREGRIARERGTRGWRLEDKGRWRWWQARRRNAVRRCRWDVTKNTNGGGVKKRKSKTRGGEKKEGVATPGASRYAKRTKRQRPQQQLYAVDTQRR
jgi:hypothetical protein